MSRWFGAGGGGVSPSDLAAQVGNPASTVGAAMRAAVAADILNPASAIGGALADSSTQLLEYAELKAAPAATTATEGAGGVAVTGLAVQVDADGSPVVLEIEGIAQVTGVGTGPTYGVIRVMEGTTEILRAAVTAANAGLHIVPVSKRRRIVPTVGLHTYSVNMFIINCTNVGLFISDTSTNRSYFTLSASTAPML